MDIGLVSSRKVTYSESLAVYTITERDKNMTMMEIRPQTSREKVRRLSSNSYLRKRVRFPRKLAKENPYGIAYRRSAASSDFYRALRGWHSKLSVTLSSL